MRPSADPEFWIWALKFLRYCWPGANKTSDQAMFELVFESQILLAEILQATGLDINHHQGGLYLHRTQRSLQATRPGIEKLAAQGYKVHLLDSEQLYKTDPALAASNIQFAGAVKVDDDFSADCHLFTEKLASYCQSHFDMSLQLSTEVQDFLFYNGHVCGVITDQGPIEADEVVVAMGAQTPNILRKLDYKVPIYPVKGYSVSLKINQPEKAPQYFAVDEGSFIALSRLGEILRLATFVEFSGYNKAIDPRAIDHLTQFAEQLFPGACDLSSANGWAGLRPMTAHGRAIIGPMPNRNNLWINSGHGHGGWGSSCGSASYLSQLINGEQTDPNKAIFNFK